MEVGGRFVAVVCIWNRHHVADKCQVQLQHFAVVFADFWKPGKRRMDHRGDDPKNVAVGDGSLAGVQDAEACVLLGAAFQRHGHEHYNFHCMFLVYMST